MPRPHFSQARYDQGVNAYRAGHSIRTVLEVITQIDEMHSEAKTYEEHCEIQDAIPNFLMGFAEGLLADIRTLVAPRRGTTA